MKRRPAPVPLSPTASRLTPKDVPSVEDVGIVIDLVAALGIAAIAGLIADRLRLPVLIGYIVAGILIGPYSPGFVADEGGVPRLATLGVAFLLFTLGVEFSIKELLAVRRVALIAAAIQMPGSAAAGILAGRLIGWDVHASILLGGVFAISSSIVLIKLLLGRGEATSPQARYGFGLMVVQDLSLVPMLALLPALEGTGGNLWLTLAESLIIAALALALVMVLGIRLVPWVLYRVARTQSRELFLLTVVAIALGTALACHYAGLSLALGAFLAGLIVSESEFDAQVLAQVIPLRDLFSTLFFVSLGMLMQFRVITEDPWGFVVVAALLVAGKSAFGVVAFVSTRINPTVAATAGLLTAQIGEFSFVLAGEGLSSHIIDSSQYALIIGVALISILVSPGLVSVAPGVGSVAGRLPFTRVPSWQSLAALDEEVELRRHVIICGFGRVARVLAEALQRRGISFVVIDINPAIVRDLRANGTHAIYGDAGTYAVLEHANIGRARTLAVTVPDLVVASAATRVAHTMNPNVDIITRAGVQGEVYTLKSDGASEVVQPEFEAGLEFTRYVMRRLGVSARELETAATRRRARFYGQDTADSIYADEVG